jgi:hypothetical protein
LAEGFIDRQPWVNDPQLSFQLISSKPKMHRLCNAVSDGHPVRPEIISTSLQDLWLS